MWRNKPTYVGTRPATCVDCARNALGSHADRALTRRSCDTRVCESETLHNAAHNDIGRFYSSIEEQVESELL